MRHRREHLVRRVGGVVPAVLDRTVLFVLWPRWEVAQRATGGRTERNWGCVPVVIRKEATWAMDRARDARGNGLVDGNGAGAAVVRSLVPVARVSVSFAVALTVSVSFLVSSSHLLVLLDCSMTFVHFAISVVSCRGAATMKILAVHTVSSQRRETSAALSSKSRTTTLETLEATCRYMT